MPSGLTSFSGSTRSIPLGLPVSLLERIKIAANKREVPYQSLIKTWLTEKAEVGRRQRRAFEAPQDG